MKLDRRDVLKLCALLLAFPRSAGAQQRLKILILGGTGFLGPHQVTAALARGHKVTIFNRGKTNKDLFPEVEQLIGDREVVDLEAVRGRSWDVVIDNCRDSPRWVGESTQLLQRATERYLYVSSISVYADPSVIGLKEDAPLACLPPGPGAANDPRNYGGAKAECERLVREAFPDRFIIPRPGLLVGPGDPTDRFTYWPVRFARGGDVLCPGSPDDPTQWLDARDAATWMIHALETSRTGIFNLTGPLPALSIGDLLRTVDRTVGNQARMIWVPAELLEKREIRGWSDMPCWVPASSDAAGFTQIDNTRAIAAGLVTRAPSETIWDTLTWYREKEPRVPLKAGLSPEREAPLLAEWHKNPDS